MRALAKKNEEIQKWTWASKLDLQLLAGFFGKKILKSFPAKL